MKSMVNKVASCEKCASFQTEREWSQSKKSVKMAVAMARAPIVTGEDRVEMVLTARR